MRACVSPGPGRGTAAGQGVQKHTPPVLKETLTSNTHGCGATAQALHVPGGHNAATGETSAGAANPAALARVQGTTRTLARAQLGPTLSADFLCAPTCLLRRTHAQVATKVELYVGTLPAGETDLRRMVMRRLGHVSFDRCEVSETQTPPGWQRSMHQGF